jgi:hypothetical protein
MSLWRFVPRPCRAALRQSANFVPIAEAPFPQPALGYSEIANLKVAPQPAVKRRLRVCKPVSDLKTIPESQYCRAQEESLIRIYPLSSPPLTARHRSAALL